MFSKSIIKYIQSLQHKKFRDEHEAFIAEGTKVVIELIAGKHFDCRNIYATDEWIKDHANDLPVSVRSRLTEVKDFEIEKMSALSTPAGVIAEFQKKHAFINLSLKNKITLFLDDIRDPGNFGTIIRTADWFNIENIICSHETVDMYNPKVIQSTMASLGRVNILYADLHEMLLKREGIRTYAAVLNGTDVRTIKKQKEAFIIIGNESKGIDPHLLENTDELITVPRYGSAESLNAAVATGILLYEWSTDH